MLKGGFFKNIFQRVDQLFSRQSRQIDEDLYEELEEAMIGADLNVHTTIAIIDRLRQAVKDKGLKDAEDVKDELREALVESLLAGDEGYFSPMKRSANAPTVYLVVGVNGVGKTTSIAKMAYRTKRPGIRSSSPLPTPFAPPRWTSFRSGAIDSAVRLFAVKRAAIRRPWSTMPSKRPGRSTPTMSSATPPAVSTHEPI